MEKFLGGTILGVLFRLVIVSVIVGTVLAALGLEPYDVIDSVYVFFVRLYNIGFEAFEKGFAYFLTGALLVVPIWLLKRLFLAGRSSKSE